MENKEYLTGQSVQEFKCLRCGKPWLPRKIGQMPLTCPRCHSPWWNRPLVRRKPKAEAGGDGTG